MRTGKSTFIKRFMETMVIPNIDNVYRRERARDELPQSGSGRTIMTAEPKFVPEEAVELQMEDGAAFSVRLIDSVGYLVPGAVGQMEEDLPRMVTTPWFDHEIPMSEGGRGGHSKGYLRALHHWHRGHHRRLHLGDSQRGLFRGGSSGSSRSCKSWAKPFLVLLNSKHPDDAHTQAMASDIASRYGVACMPIDCQSLSQEDITSIIQAVLYEFPIKELELFLPSWVDALPHGHPIKDALYAAIRESSAQLHRLRQVRTRHRPDGSVRLHRPDEHPYHPVGYRRGHGGIERAPQPVLSDAERAVRSGGER